MAGKFVRTLLGAAAAVLLVLLGGALWLASQALSERPVIAPRTVHPLELWRGKVIAEYMLFPGRRGGTFAPDMNLGAGELELGLNYLLGRAGFGQARVRLDPDALRLDASLALPGRARGRYLNAGVVLRPAGSGLALDRLLVGERELPGGLSRLLARLLLRLAPRAMDADLANRLLAAISLRTQAHRTTLAWHGDRVQAVMATLRTRLLGLEAGLLHAYQDALAELAVRRPRPAFPEVLGELFRLARQRSAQGDPVRENRALLVSLAEQLNGLNLADGQRRPAARLTGMRLAGRGDFVEHLTLSAALAAVAGGELADAAGLMKEMGDTERGGSGFSFTDLAVDRAGTRLGRLAVASAASARRVQAMLAGSADASLYLPALRDLPEFLPQGEFKRRFGGIEGAGYLALIGEIDRRIDALPLHRDPGDG